MCLAGTAPPLKPTSSVLSSVLPSFLSDSPSLYSHTHTPLSKVSHLTIFCIGYKSTSPKLDTSFPGGSVVKDLPANAGEADLIPGWGKYLGEGKGKVKYCCLGNLMERGAWWAIVHGVAKSWTGFRH